MFSSFVKVTSNYSKMPFIFRFYVDNYGINSAQTNQIMTTACGIVKLQPEPCNKSILLKEISYKTIFFITKAQITANYFGF